MKKASLLTVLFLAVGLGWCQASIRIAVLGGYALPIQKGYGSAFAYGAGLSIDLHRNFALELRGVRYQSQIEGSLEGLSKGALAVMPVEIGLQGRFPLSGEKLVPFVAVGAGYFFHNFSLDPQVAADWDKLGFSISEKLDNAVGFHVGAGLEIGLNQGLALVLEARFRIVQSRGSWVMSDLIGNEDISGDLSQLSQSSIVFGLGLQFSIR